MVKLPRITPFCLLIFSMICFSFSNKKVQIKDKPNIILIFADDMGYGEPGCYGQKIIKTPNIDKLAKEGLLFTNYYSGSPVCAPSRCVMLTGKHTGHSYIRGNMGIRPEGQIHIVDSEVTIAEILKKEGYKTAAIGKWGLGFINTEGDPNNQGFDYFYGYNCQRQAHNYYPYYLWRNNVRDTLWGNHRSHTGEQYSQDIFTREALIFIEENKNNPFFLYLPLTIPHLSIQVPEESLEQYKGIIPEEEYNHLNKKYEKHPFPRAGRAAMISHMDRDIGKIISLLKELELDKNTIIIFTSDNGPPGDRSGGADSEYFNSTGPLRGSKGTLYEGGIRVPMIVRWPGQIRKGVTTNHVSGFQDLLPTIAELVKSDHPEDIDGISFLPVLYGNDSLQKRHQYLYWEFPSYGGQQALRMGNWKAIKRNLFKNPDAQMELFNLMNDVAEQNDISSDHPEIVKKMNKIMDDVRITSEYFPFPALDTDTISNHTVDE